MIIDQEVAAWPHCFRIGHVAWPDAVHSSGSLAGTRQSRSREPSTFFQWQDVYIYPPNQPPAGRCFNFGRALARAISSWPVDRTVALIASGGLTHFVVDESFDQKVLDALRKGDPATLSSLPEDMFQAGTSEIKNWITVAGAMAEVGFSMTLVDYVPCYRSEAGTGSAMGFAHWQ